MVPGGMIVLNSTSLHIIPAYSSQSSDFAQTLAGIGLSEFDKAGGGSWKRFPKPRVARLGRVLSLMTVGVPVRSDSIGVQDSLTDRMFRYI